MKIKLIAPHESGEEVIYSAETFKIRKVGLPLLAALTPAGHSVRIVDEAFAPDDMDEEVDLVGVSVMTELALRAYCIADAYRARGVKVVMGGIHPTVVPSEASRHADAVVVGEAEDTWPGLVADAASGRLQPIYRATRAVDLAGLPIPRRDLYPRPARKGYTPPATGVETARGCPYDCEFCSIGSVMGRGYRVRPVPEVLAEIESLDSQHLFFVDDALALNRAVARELFAAMIPLRRRWVGQGTASLAEDPELLRVMRRSGCVGLLIGFESVAPGAQSGMRKIENLTIDFLEAVHRLHEEGIAVMGAFIFGFDGEDRDVFDRTLEFAERSRLDGIELRVLCPFPGTRLYRRLVAEGRLIDAEWWLRGHPPDTLLYRPRGMTVDEFLEGFARVSREAYSLGAVARRFFGMSPLKRTALGCQVYFGLNLATRKRYMKSLDIPQPLRGFSTSEASPAESPAGDRAALSGPDAAGG